MTEGNAIGEMRRLGSRRGLFVDDWLIDRMSGVHLKMHSPISREVALEFNRPWEGPVSYDPVIMKNLWDGGLVVPCERHAHHDGLKEGLFPA